MHACNPCPGRQGRQVPVDWLHVRPVGHPDRRQSGTHWPLQGPLVQQTQFVAQVGHTLVTASVVVAWELPEPFVAVSVTEYDPAIEYVCDGFWLVDVPPSPKVQDQDVGDPVEVSVKVTAEPAAGEDGE